MLSQLVLTKVRKKEILDLLRSLGHTFEVAEEKLESYAIMSAMLPTYFWFQWNELGSRLDRKSDLHEDRGRRTQFMKPFLHPLNLMYKSELTPEEVIDLIPVKPIGEHETQITEIYTETMALKNYPAFEPLRKSKALSLFTQSNINKNLFEYF